MSNPFGSTNLFSTVNNSSGIDKSYAPQLGLRQRHSSANNSDNVGARSGDENANPNSAPRDIPNDGKWGAISKVPAPPRVSLASSGKSTFNARRSATAQQQQSFTENRSSANAESKQRSPEQTKEKEEEDLSLWVVVYGYRTEAHFRALYQRLENCGVITARRGGLSCFGESKKDHDDNGNNWVAVRFESALCAQKALCQHGNWASIDGSTVVNGVMPLESDAAAKLGIINNGSGPSQNTVKLSGSYNNRNRHGLRAEEDVLLYEGDQGGIINNEVKYGLDSLCGKVLAWFFMWDTQS